jgi:nucleoside-diphosphate-sugar epimerase
VQFTPNDRLLVTGGTGLVGSHIAEQAVERGIRTRVVVRESSDTSFLKTLDVEVVHGDINDRASLNKAVHDVTAIVHCAAMVGDWGPIEPYRHVNVVGTDNLIQASVATGQLKKFVHISSLGVYPARDHYGTDESVQPDPQGIDGYTLTKIESEQLVLKHVTDNNLPAVVLRPGFIYGTRDRTVLPRILEKLSDGKFAFLGSKDTRVNNTWVGNLCDAVFLAIERDDLNGECFNITDGRTVTKGEFIETIANTAGYKIPTKVVPLPVARTLAKIMEATWKLLGKKEAPLLSNAKIKFLGLNLDYSIDKAKQQLGYAPQTDFKDAMTSTVQWFQSAGLLP